MDLLAELETGVVIADGAMGTQLLAAGLTLEDCLEERCVTRPELVAEIHESYIAAGARIIRTNSFGANAARLARFGFERRVSELNWSAAQVARASAKGKGVAVAGSVGPLGRDDLSARERHQMFEDQIGALLDGGAQFIMLETFQSLEELLVAVEVKHSLHHCAVVCNLVSDDAGRLPNGTTLANVWTKLRAVEADVVGVNCTSDPRSMPRLFENVTIDAPLSAFPNAGPPPGDLLPDEFAQLALSLADRGVRLIGGCCGTTPAHLAAFAAALHERAA
jgi:homocysteine S-methyltransferase